MRHLWPTVSICACDFRQGIHHVLREFANGRGWTMSAAATKLIGERLDHYSVVEQRQDKALNEILAILKGQQAEPTDAA
jgi:hypothetical protein